MKTLKTTGQHLQQFFTRLAFDDAISYKELINKAKDEEELLLGEFMYDYSHNNSDYCDELRNRIYQSFSELEIEDSKRFYNTCQGFCELFEVEYEVCSFNVLAEINYISEKLEEAKQFELDCEE